MAMQLKPELSHQNYDITIEKWGIYDLKEKQLTSLRFKQAIRLELSDGIKMIKLTANSVPQGNYRH